MKIATWNVNSLNVRLEHVLKWLKTNNPDILVLQEIKQITENFAKDQFSKAGYHSVANGQKTYNGVAVITLNEPSDIVLEIPKFQDPQKRILACTIGNTRVINLYIPNGSELDSDKYIYKLNWLDALTCFLRSEIKKHNNLIILGDFNIAPTDKDVHDTKIWNNGILCSPPERKALQEILDLGFIDVFRQFKQPEKTFSWWDYRAAGFRRNAGLRIDLILASKNLSLNCKSSYIDKEPRSWERPSDHTPVVAEFNI